VKGSLDLKTLDPLRLSGARAQVQKLIPEPRGRRLEALARGGAGVGVSWGGVGWGGVGWGAVSEQEEE